MNIPKTGERRVGVAHPGTQHSWQTAIAFQKAGLLEWYATSYYYKPSSFPETLVKYLPKKLAASATRELSRRHHSEIDENLVRRAFETEFLERPVGKYFSRELMLRLQQGRHLRFPHRLKKIQRAAPVNYIWGPMDCLEAFTDSTRSAEWILDQPIGHYCSLKRVLDEEYRRHPDFFHNNTPISAEKIDRQIASTETADRIVVGSQFAADTLLENGVPREKIHVIPYGYSRPPAPPRHRDPAEYRNRPIEFLFVGSLGARKGAAPLLSAFDQIDPRLARLTVVGPLDMPVETLARYTRNLDYKGQVTRQEVYNFMASSDCFVFPSLFEGSALVLYEALAAGLPIIQSKSAGTGVVGGANGILLKETATQELVEAIHTACSPDMLVEWSTASQKLSPSYNWEKYHENVVHLVESEI